jgi:tetratricopeptide (TPR) repeat protein
MDLVERAARLHARALSQSERSRFDLADRGLRRALEYLARAELDEQPGALAVKVRVLTTLSTVEVELSGQRASGLDPEGLLAQAQLIAEQLADPGVAFAVENALALQALRRGDHEVALLRFEAAERHVADASINDASVFYLNRGNLRLQRLELSTARRDFDRCIALAAAVDVADASKMKVSEFMARHNLGYLEFLAGNLPRALEMMDQAAAIPSGASLAISALDKSRVLIEAGLSDAADAALLSAEREFRRGRLYHELAETELARAECAILAGNLKAARALAGSARTRFARRGNDRWRRVAELTLLSADLADGRPPTRLIGPAERLAEQFREQGLALQSRTAALIAVAALTTAGQLERAEQLLAELPRMRPSDPISAKLQQRTVAATLQRQSGQSVLAQRQVRLGLSELSRHQAQFGSIDLQTASAIHGRALVRLDLEMSLASRRPAAVFDAVERGRVVSRRLTAVTPPAGESADMLAELRGLSELVKTIGDDPAAAEEARGIRHRMAGLQHELSAISWRAIGAGQVAHPASMSAVAAAAEEENKVVVSFCPGPDQWAAVVLGDGRPRLALLTRDSQVGRSTGTISQAIVELARRAQADLSVLAYPTIPEELRLVAESSLNRSLAALEELLLTPLELGDRSMVIVPTSLTATLPWNCLPSLRGRPVEVSPTATSWLAGVRAIDHEGHVRVEAFSGPGLDTATDEADMVATIWQPTAEVSLSHRDGSATRDRLAAALVADTVVHVAAHGSHVRQNPLFSSLELADGPLFAYEVADRRVAPHVVLSACELGQATTRPGDEALGLTRVLLQLGAQCVVAGVAQVADERAVTVMSDYHRRLAAGDDSASALASATASGPYVPFVCFGSSWRADPRGVRSSSGG